MSEQLIDTFIGLITGVVSTAIYDRLWPWVVKRRCDRILARFWRFKHKLVYIVRPGYPDYLNPSGEPVGLNMARVEDIRAIDALTDMLQRRNIHPTVVDHSTGIPPDADIILVCSPKGNLRSAEALEALPLPYSFEMSDPKKPYFVEKGMGIEYRSPMDTVNAKRDIALIGRYTAKGSGQLMFLLWGIHGVGTLAAAKCSVNPAHVRHLNREVGDRDFSVLVECGYSKMCDVETCGLLTEPRVLGA